MYAMTLVDISMAAARLDNLKVEFFIMLSLQFVIFESPSLWRVADCQAPSDFEYSLGKGSQHSPIRVKIGTES